MTQPGSRSVLRTVANRHPEVGGQPWGWVEQDGRQTRITWGGQEARDLLDATFRAAALAPHGVGGMECPMCGGEGRIYDITAAIEEAQAAGTVLMPISRAREVQP